MGGARDGERRREAGQVRDETVEGPRWGEDVGGKRGRWQPLSAASHDVRRFAPRTAGNIFSGGNRITATPRPRPAREAKRRGDVA